MIFRNQIKRGCGILNRGEQCLFRSVEAIYLGSFKDEEDACWNHMLLVQQILAGELVSVEEFIVTTQDVKDIIFARMMREPVEGQMQLC